jgi:hypothetical protein
MRSILTTIIRRSGRLSFQEQSTNDRRPPHFQKETLKYRTHLVFFGLLATEGNAGNGGGDWAIWDL